MTHRSVLLTSFPLLSLMGVVACSAGPAPTDTPSESVRSESAAIVAPGPSWQGWDSLSGGLITDPAIVAESASKLSVFATGPDGAVYERFYDGTQWIGGGYWVYLGNGGTRLDAPAAATFNGDHIELFARNDTTHHLMHREAVGFASDAPAWNAAGWEDLGGDLAPGTPTVVLSQPGNQVNVFVTGTNGRAATIAVHGYGSYGGWVDLSGGVLYEPGAASWGNNRLDVFVAGTDNGLYHRYSIDNGTTWWPAGGGWEGVGGSIAATPAVTSWSSNRLDIVATATDGSINHLAWEGNSWGTCPAKAGPCWTSPGGVAYSDPENGYAAPTAIATGASSLQIFVQGTDQELYTNSFNGLDANQNPTWTGWSSIAPGFRTAGVAAVTSRDDATLDVAITKYAANGDGKVWHGATTGGALTFPGIGSSAPLAVACGGDGQACCDHDGCTGTTDICLAFGPVRTCSPRTTNYTTATESELAVPLFVQEEPNWCWDATEQMILSYLGISTAQCTLADMEGYVPAGVDCCSSQAVKNSCDHGGYPRYSLWNISSSGEQSAPLSWTALTNEIDAGRPFNFSWDWQDGGSHDMVVSGYKIASGTGLQYVTINNPEGERYSLLYSEWIGETGNYTFAYNEYDIHKN